MIAVGTGAVLAPVVSATMYGLPASDRVAHAFVRATGVRDVVLGAIVLASLGEARALRRALGWSSVIAIADAVILAAARGPRPSHGAHLAGGAALILAALTIEP